MEILLDLLKEIRNDLKNNPSREEFSALEDKVEKIRTEQDSIKSKIAMASGIVSIIASILTAILTKYLAR